MTLNAERSTFKHLEFQKCRFKLLNGLLLLYISLTKKNFSLVVKLSRNPLALIPFRFIEYDKCT